jgi:type VI secretion system protein ImpB
MTSIFDKIKTVRKPRVQISYELEQGDATVRKELPFVVGVLGDFSGKPTKPLKNFKKRKFINIHGENFNEVMEKMSPGVEMRVKNTIKNDDSEMPVKLSFSNMDDFSPSQIAENVPALKRLLNIRGKLKDLLSKAERSEELEKKLEDILQSEDQLKALSEVFQSQNSQGESKTESDNSEGSE